MSPTFEEEEMDMRDFIEGVNTDLNTALMDYAVEAAAQIDEIIDLLKLAKVAYEKSIEAGRAGKRKEMDHQRGEGTQFLFMAKKKWEKKDD